MDAQFWLPEWHHLQKSEVKVTRTKLTGAKGDAEEVGKAKDSAETKLSKISSELDGTLFLLWLQSRPSFSHHVSLTQPLLL